MLGPKYRRFAARQKNKRQAALWQKIKDFIKLNPGFAIDILVSPDMEFEIEELLRPPPYSNIERAVRNNFPWPRLLVSPLLRKRTMALMVSLGRGR